MENARGRWGTGMDANLARTTVRIVTWRLIPLLLLAYLAAYVDRINIGFAGAALKHDFAFSNSVFGFGAGLFFVSYFLFEVPSNLLLAKFGARRWIARIMVDLGPAVGGHGLRAGTVQFLSCSLSARFCRGGLFPRRDLL